MTSPTPPDAVRAILDSHTGEIHVVDGDDLAITLTPEEARALAAQLAELTKNGAQ